MLKSKIHIHTFKCMFNQFNSYYSTHNILIILKKMNRNYFFFLNYAGFEFRLTYQFKTTNDCSILKYVFLKGIHIG